MDPVGTAPGVVVPGKPTVVVLPGPPRELQPMWKTAVQIPAVQEAIAGRTIYRQDTIRMFGLPESGLAETLREAEHDVPGFAALEITTCLRRGEIEMVTRYEPDAADTYRQLSEYLRDRHWQQIFSEDGSQVDDQIAHLLTGRRIAIAESCTGGLLSARLTERPGSSAYLAGGLVAYANEAKTDLLGVDPALIDAHGAVSEPVAEAMAAGALRRFGADTAVAITGIAGPGGGTEEKPVGTVCFTVALADGGSSTRTLLLPGSRNDIRERSTTVAMHLLRQALSELSDDKDWRRAGMRPSGCGSRSRARRTHRLVGTSVRPGGQARRGRAHRRSLCRNRTHGCRLGREPAEAGDIGHTVPFPLGPTHPCNCKAALPLSPPAENVLQPAGPTINHPMGR